MPVVGVGWEEGPPSAAFVRVRTECETDVVFHSSEKVKFGTMSPIIPNFIFLRHRRSLQKNTIEIRQCAVVRLSQMPDGFAR